MEELQSRADEVDGECEGLDFWGCTDEDFDGLDEGFAGGVVNLWVVGGWGRAERWRFWGGGGGILMALVDV